MANHINDTEERLEGSVALLYEKVLQKRKTERDEKRAKKAEQEELRRKEREEKEKNKEEGKEEKDPVKMSKKERREAAFESWKSVVENLTGEDIEYSSPKRKKKKYRMWFGDEDKQNTITTKKPKKHKKKNFNKEFEYELHMLKALAVDQGKFTQDLQKRYQLMAGPNTKDASPLNKTQVDLASAINASRANSLGVLREIGSIKKSIADLSMKQRKMEYDMGSGGDVTTTDLGLMGSSIASSLFGDDMTPVPSSNPSPVVQQTFQATPAVPQPSAPVVQSNTFKEEEFDPASWNGGASLDPSNSVRFEAIPHNTVVEWDKENNRARFKAVRTDTGEELVGCPVPLVDPSKLKFNETDKTVKGEFDEIYPLEIH